MKSTSLERRVLLGLALAFAAGAGALSLSLYDTRDQLRRVAMVIQAREIAEGFTMQSDPARLPKSHAGGELSYTLYSPEGRVLWFSGNLQSPRRLRLPPDGARAPLLRLPIYSGQIVNVAAPLADGATLMVAKRDVLERQAIGDLLHAKLLQSLVMLVPVGLLALLLIYWMMRWTLRPVQQAARFVQGMKPGQVQPIPTARLPRELLPLADAVNRALENLAQSLANEKRLVADAAHELRTPLTVLDLRLQKARMDPRPDWQAVDGDVRYLRRVAEQLLLLARQEQDLGAGEAAPAAASTHLTRLVREAIAAILPLFEAGSRSMQVDLIDGVHCQGDASLLHTAISNVLENAFHHGQGDVLVAMTAVEGDVIRLTVADQGPGVPSDRQEAMFTRFSKARPGSRGAGLGLAITRKILRNAGGTSAFWAVPIASWNCASGVHRMGLLRQGPLANKTRMIVILVVDFSPPPAMPTPSASWTAARWHQLFCACQQQLVAYLAGKTGSRDEAQELAQETWLRLADAPPQLPDGSSPTLEAARAYLFATAKHLAIDRLRQRGAQQRCMDDWAQLQPEAEGDVADRAMYRQALAVVERTIADLPERMQAALLAHRLHGERQADIAERLQVSLNTVERDLMQADACLEAALLRWRGGVEAGLQSSSRKRRRRALGALLGAAGMACAAWPAWQMWSRRVLWQGELASATGVQRSLELPDGSVLRVDAASRVALTYRADLRQAQLLEGAAFFAVARDAARPFVVEAGPLRVTVLGTRFGVELEPDAVRVQVESGQVRVEHAATGRSQLLQDSQSLRIPLDGGAGDADGAAWQPQLQQRPAAWREGELVFEQEPLGRVVHRLGRYTRRRLVVEEGAAQLAISGHVRIAQTERWLRGLPQFAPVQVSVLDDGGLRIARRGGRAEP